MTEGIGRELFHVALDARCEGAPCITVSRPLETTVDEHRDVIDEEIGTGLRVRMPTAVWTDGTSTLPHAVTSPPPPFMPGEFAARIATAMDVWLVLRWFYPYSEDVALHWDAEFPSLMQNAARARTADALEHVIQELVAKLRDGHAFVNRFTIDGTWPFMTRRLGQELVVLKSLAGYDKILPRGSTITAVDGLPIAEVLARVRPYVSSPTEANLDYALGQFLSYGRTGELVRVSVRTDATNAGTREVVVPRLYATVIEELHEDKPTQGEQLAPGVFYVDLSTLSQGKLDELLPVLVNAKAVICDVRGLVPHAAWRLVTHLLSHTIDSPRLYTPVVTPAGIRHYEDDTWSVAAKLPHISARAIFLADGRSISQDETLLQMVKSTHLGTIVGEPSAGTNGNMVIYNTMGRMKILFTGMRVLNADGTLLHGHGIVPDVIQHPTVAGIASGRDEILDAATRIASGL